MKNLFTKHNTLYIRREDRWPLFRRPRDG